MKKLALAIAAAAVSLASVTSFAQPAPPHGPGADPRHDQPMHRESRPHPKKKVWVPAHREHGHMVKGHYVWR
jgi:hypothetical protein